MRLTENQIRIIKSCVSEIFGNGSKVLLFGSRVDDNKKGGDIDLYIETDIQNDVVSKKIDLLVKLKDQLGDQKIDIVINNFRYNLPIYSVAKSEGIVL